MSLEQLSLFTEPTHWINETELQPGDIVAREENAQHHNLIHSIDFHPNGRLSTIEGINYWAHHKTPTWQRGKEGSWSMHYPPGRERLRPTSYVLVSRKETL